MSVDETQEILDRYFEAMGHDEDFSKFYAEDVTWIMMETGQEVRGPAMVRDFVLELHSRMFGGDQRDPVVSDGHVYLEGDAANAPGATEPIFRYCLSFDMRAGRIAAVRCYGTLGALLPGWIS